MLSSGGYFVQGDKIGSQLKTKHASEASSKSEGEQRMQISARMLTSRARQVGRVGTGPGYSASFA